VNGKPREYERVEITTYNIWSNVKTNLVDHVEENGSRINNSPISYTTEILERMEGNFSYSLLPSITQRNTHFNSSTIDLPVP